jgi:hypothetical protein
MCARIGIAELKKPMRFCNRYISVSAGLSDDGSVTNGVLSGTAADLGDALSMIDAFTGKPPTVTGVNVLLKVHRGADQAFIRRVSLPRTVRRGQRVRVKVSLQRVRGGAFTRSYRMRIPSRTPRGRQQLRFVGQDADQGADIFSTIIIGDEDDNQGEGGFRGPKNLRRLAKQIRATGRYDGVSLRAGDETVAKAFRDDDFRISGNAEATVRVRR